jgi:hypothetical protein
VIEKRRPTREEWRAITSPRAGRRGIRASPELLRALRASEAGEWGKGTRGEAK